MRGITIREIVEEIGGGILDNKKFKAVQIGGPSGGCIPESHADIPIDFKSLNEYGAMMGSGGLVVLDENDCMVDIARYFMAFTQKESCGRCTFCLIGTKQMLEILERICNGNGKEDDLQGLEHLAGFINKGSISKGIQGTYVVSTHIPFETPDWAIVVELPVLEAYRTIIISLIISILIIVLSFDDSSSKVEFNLSISSFLFSIVSYNF